jgi:hypothetical protein
MRTTPSIVVLSNTHQVVSLKLTTTNYLYWWMQMKSYLIGQGVFHFIDGLVSCPPSHVSNCSDGSSSAINPSFLHWKQHDQLILNALLSSLSMDVVTPSRELDVGRHFLRSEDWYWGLSVVKKGVAT